jgi:hypothetical protein
MSKLRKLRFERTLVTDLRPLAEFREMIDQWQKDDELESVVDYDYSDDDYGGRGLYYEGTPVATRQPYCWFVEMRDGRRTIETINWVRSEERQLSTYWPDGYVPARGVALR